MTLLALFKNKRGKKNTELKCPMSSEITSSPKGGKVNVNWGD